jgi:hypothetical protein
MLGGLVICPFSELGEDSALILGVGDIFRDYWALFNVRLGIVVVGVVRHIVWSLLWFARL